MIMMYDGVRIIVAQQTQSHTSSQSIQDRATFTPSGNSLSRYWNIFVVDNYVVTLIRGLAMILCHGVLSFDFIMSRSGVGRRRERREKMDENL